MHLLESRPSLVSNNRMLRRLVVGPDEVRADLAAWGFYALDDKAWPAVVDLTRIMYNSKSGRPRENAKWVILRMPGDTVRILAEGLTDKSAENRASVAAYLSCCAQFPNESFVYPAPAVPLFIKAMNDGDPRVVVAAARSLRRLGVRVDLTVPALTDKLSSPTDEVRAAVACALGGFQAQAHAAVPSLVRALTDPSIAVRVAFTNALNQVAPEALIAQRR